MCEGTRVPHSGQLLRMGARQRVAPRRIFERLLDWRRLGTAMVVSQLRVVLEVLQRVECGPTVVGPGAGGGLYVIFGRFVYC